MTDLIKGLTDEQLRVLAADANRELRERERKIDLSEITPERLRDPHFAAQVRAEVDRALREL